jgi:hypothetical protein
MNRKATTVLAAAALALAGLAAAVGPASAATVRHVEGRVVSVDRDARSFRLRDSERGTFRVYVTRSTRFERTSFSALRSGAGIEATIRRANGRWQASEVESHRGEHGGGGSDDRGGDDRGRGRGSDDRGGDDSR